MSETVAAVNTQDDNTEQKLVTVFENSLNFNVKHPLQQRWKFWFNGPPKKATSDSWNASFKEMIVIDTVEDFWGVYNNIAGASNLPENASYFLFLDGVFPDWGDPASKNGGRWQFSLQNASGERLDECWLNTLLAVIGDTFPDSDEILGAVVSSKRHMNRIELWTRSSDTEDVLIRTSSQWKAVLGLSPDSKLQFKKHSK